MRALRVALLVSGCAVIVMLVMAIGPGEIVSSFSKLSWRLLVIVVFPSCLVMLFDTLGWRFAFRRDQVPFATLVSTRMAGEAVNVTTATASVGGDVMKAWLVRAYVPLDEGLSSVIVAKTTITIAQALFLLLGLVVARPILPAGSPLLRGMQWLLVLEVLAVGGFVLVQVVGVLGSGMRILRRLGMVAAAGDPLGGMDRSLSRFYREEPQRLFLSTTCHFLGWALSAGEAYVILRALELPVSITTAVIVEAFGTGIRFASFMVPAHLGAVEGGQVATFAALGLGGPAGLTFVLVRRVREIAWTGLGFLLLAAAGARRAVPPRPGPEN